MAMLWTYLIDAPCTMTPITRIQVCAWNPFHPPICPSACHPAPLQSRRLAENSRAQMLQDSLTRLEKSLEVSAQWLHTYGLQAHNRKQGLVSTSCEV